MKYFLNSLYYGFWKVNVALYSNGIKAAYLIFQYMVSLLLPHKFENRVLDRLKENKKQAHKDLKNYKSGIIIQLFEQSFLVLYGMYASPLDFVVFSVVYVITNSSWLSMSAGFLCFGLSCIPVYKHLIVKKEYIKFFSVAEHKDSIWIRKWKTIAIIFWLFALPVFIGGSMLMKPILD